MVPYNSQQVLALGSWGISAACWDMFGSESSSLEGFPPGTEYGQNTAIARLQRSGRMMTGYAEENKDGGRWYREGKEGKAGDIGQMHLDCLLHSLASGMNVSQSVAVKVMYSTQQAISKQSVWTWILISMLIGYGIVASESCRISAMVQYAMIFIAR